MIDEVLAHVVIQPRGDDVLVRLPSTCHGPRVRGALRGQDNARRLGDHLEGTAAEGHNRPLLLLCYGGRKEGVGP